LHAVENEFRVDVHSTNAGVVLEVFGELDVASAPQLEAQLERADDAPLVVIDLSSLEFIDSTGLGILVRAHQTAQEHDRQFALVQGTGQVERLLDLTGIADQLPVVATADELLGGI
jgi:anti-sigma B factor antagonist